MANKVDADDPLRELLVDAAEVDRRRIADALKGRVSIDSKTGSLHLMPGYSSLDARGKILSVLLARKASALLKLIDGEALTNKEVTELTGLAPGTAAPGLRKLKELRLIDQDASKAYFIPNTHLSDVICVVMEE